MAACLDVSYYLPSEEAYYTDYISHNLYRTLKGTNVSKRVIKSTLQTTLSNISSTYRLSHNRIPSTYRATMWTHSWVRSFKDWQCFWMNLAPKNKNSTRQDTITDCHIYQLTYSSGGPPILNSLANNLATDNPCLSKSAGFLSVGQ